MKRFLLFLLAFSMIVSFSLLFSGCKGTPPTETTTAATTTLPVSSNPHHSCTTTAPVTTTPPVTTKDPYGNDNNVSAGDIF